MRPLCSEGAGALKAVPQVEHSDSFCNSMKQNLFVIPLHTSIALQTCMPATFTHWDLDRSGQKHGHTLFGRTLSREYTWAYLTENGKTDRADISHVNGFLQSKQSDSQHTYLH